MSISKMSKDGSASESENSILDDAEKELTKLSKGSSSADIDAEKILFPERRIIIRRPASGICQFCLKAISATNWSRHLRSMHLQAIIDMRGGESSHLSPFSLTKAEIEPPVEMTPPLPPIPRVRKKTERKKKTEKEKKIKIEEEKKVVVKTESNEASELGQEENASIGICEKLEAPAEDQKPSPKKLRRSARNVKKRIVKRSLIQLPKTNICSLCQKQTSAGNWSRHLKRHHPEYAPKDCEDWDEAGGEHQPMELGEGQATGIDMQIYQLQQFLAQQGEQSDFGLGSMFATVENDAAAGGGDGLKMDVELKFENRDKDEQQDVHNGGLGGMMDGGGGLEQEEEENISSNNVTVQPTAAAAGTADVSTKNALIAETSILLNRHLQHRSSPTLHKSIDNDGLLNQHRHEMEQMSNGHGETMSRGNGDAAMEKNATVVHYKQQANMDTDILDSMNRANHLLSPKQKNVISTHVLDMATGRPAEGVHCKAFKYDRGDAEWTQIGEMITNAQGRIPAVHPTVSLSKGVYKLRFAIKEYFAKHGQHSQFPHIDVMLEVDDPNDQLHIPLFLSPFGYSVYKGQ